MAIDYDDRKFSYARWLLDYYSIVFCTVYNLSNNLSKNDFFSGYNEIASNRSKNTANAFID